MIMIKKFLLISKRFFFFEVLILKRRPIETIDEGLLQIRSSAWLEHYTDNVGVTSSNLVGSTWISS